MTKHILNSIAQLLRIKRRFFLSEGVPANVTVSYAVTVCNEAEALARLLDTLIPYLAAGDEIIVQADAANVTQKVKDIVQHYDAFIHTYAEHELRFDFAQAKNHLNSLCKGSYIFQLDADEYPDSWLLAHLKQIITANPGIELFKVPRINRFTKNGTLEYDHQQWPDYQGRIYRNEPQRIVWHRPLHERITGHRSYVYLPKNDSYAIIHCKDVDQHNEKWKELTPHLIPSRQD